MSRPKYRDWLEEVWEIKEKLSKIAWKKGIGEYLISLEREADRVLADRKTRRKAVLEKER